MAKRRPRRGTAFSQALLAADIDAESLDGVAARVEVPSLHVPEEMRLFPDDILGWSIGADAEAYVERTPQVECLATFLRLADATRVAMLRFAGTWGPLGLCERHELPDAHDGP